MNLATVNRNMEFACYALALAKAGGKHEQAAAIVGGMRNFERVQLALKAAVPMGTSSSTEYGQLVSFQTVAAGFVESLRSTSVLDAILPFARRVPLRSSLAIVTSASNAARQTPGGAKIVTRLSLAPGGLSPLDVAAMVVLTEEVLRLSTSAALQLIDRELTAGVSVACNAEFLAGVVSGIAAQASTGNFLADLRLMLASVNSVGVGRYFLVMGAGIANEISTLPSAPGEQTPAFPSMSPNGGSLQSIPALVVGDAEMPADSGGPLDLILLEAGQIAAAADAPLLSSSRYATIQMDDDPSLPGNLVSMFQTNSAVIRAERKIGFERLRDSAVAAISGAEYGSAS